MSPEEGAKAHSHNGRPAPCTHAPLRPCIHAGGALAPQEVLRRKIGCIGELLAKYSQEVSGGWAVGGWWLMVVDGGVQLAVGGS